jgi:membrane-associated phospholipid phosphatase
MTAMPARTFLFILVLLTARTGLAAPEQGAFPYRLDTAIDAPLLSVGCVTASVSLYLYSVRPVAGWLETIRARRGNLNGLDRPAVGMHLAGAALTSDVLTITASVAPLLLAVPYLKKREYMNSLTLVVMYAEVLLFVEAANVMCKSLVNRKRPYMYVSNLFERKPRDRFSSSSFYSLHTSLAFGSMVFLSTAVGDLFQSGIRYLVLAGALPIAAAAGYFRFAAGLHFPTDILAGALIGSVIGYCIPALHRLSSDTIGVSFFSGETTGIKVQLRF